MSQEKEDCKCTVPVEIVTYAELPFAEQCFTFIDNMTNLAQSLQGLDRVFLAKIIQNYLNCNKEQWLAYGNKTAIQVNTEIQEKKNATK